MERRGLVVRDRLHLSLQCVDGKDLGIQPRGECGMDNGGIAGTRIQVGRNGHDPRFAAAIARSAYLFNEGAVNVDERRVDEIAEELLPQLLDLLQVLVAEIVRLAELAREAVTAGAPPAREGVMKSEEVGVLCVL